MSISKGKWERPRDKGAVDSEPRHPAELDNDRVLYSSAFRRLVGVTQVVSPQDDYVYHDRLQHSLKVAQVASRLTQELRKKHTAARLLNPLVVHAASLAHDLGHPPFGHCAEDELQRVLEGRTDRKGKQPATIMPILRDSFEGNAQTLRIATTISFRKREENAGLNLTFRTYAAILKYPWKRGKHPKKRPDLERKWGAYDSDSQLLDRAIAVSKKSGTWRNGRSVEAAIMDWSDDVAYAVHDIEDFYRAGMIPLHRLKHDQNEWNLFCEYAESLISPRPDVKWNSKALDRIRAQIHPLLPEGPYIGSSDNRYDLHLFASQCIKRLSSGVRYTSKGLQIPNQFVAEAEFLKKLTRYYVVSHPNTQVLQRGHQRVVRELFFDLHELCTDTLGGDNWSRRHLPARLADYADAALADDVVEDGRSEQQKLARATVDFIASLTDRQASLLHAKLAGGAEIPVSPHWLTV